MILRFPARLAGVAGGLVAAAGRLLISVREVASIPGGSASAPTPARLVPAAQDVATAGNGGGATAHANGGAVALGDVNAAGYLRGGLTSGSGVSVIEGGLYPVGNPAESPNADFHDFWSDSGFSFFDDLTFSPRAISVSGSSGATNISISANGGTAIADASGAGGSMSIPLS
jgi:hypothetical protein